MSAVPDLPGFADPVADAQAAFRAVLHALSHPGQVVTPAATLLVPAPLPQAAGALLLTLADAETPLWLDPAFVPARDWVRFHTGASFAPLGAAGFVVAASLPPLPGLATGSDEAPQDGASVILPVAALHEGTRYRLTGPGLAAPASFAARGLPADFVTFWRDNHALFPRGVDLFLCAGAQLLALPRSVVVEAL